MEMLFYQPSVSLSLNSNVLFICFYVFFAGTAIFINLNNMQTRSIHYFLWMLSRSKDDSPESVEGPRFTLHDNGSLEIYSVEEDDAGQYTCLAKNIEGSSAIDAMLYVKGKAFFLGLEVLKVL